MTVETIDLSTEVTGGEAARAVVVRTVADNVAAGGVSEKYNIYSIDFVDIGLPCKCWSIDEFCIRAVAIPLDVINFNCASILLNQIFYSAKPKKTSSIPSRLPHDIYEYLFVMVFLNVFS